MDRLSVFFYIINFITIFSLSILGNSAFGSPYVYTGDSKVSVEQFEYLEGLDNDASLSALKNGDWNKKIQNIQSYYNGFWVRLSVFNKTNEINLGVRHWTTFENKLYAINSNGIQEYEYISFYDDSYSFIGVDRIQFRYRIMMPTDEITTIYSFYRFRPLHRTLSTRHEIFGIDTWENLQSQSFFQIM